MGSAVTVGWQQPTLPLSSEALCIDKSAELDRCAENFMVRPAPSAEDTNTNFCFVLIPHPAPKVSSLGAVNVSGPKNSTRSLVVFFGCNRYDCSRLTPQPNAIPRKSMASFHIVLRTRSRQKSQALRMLLTSGVIRSAAVDPPRMAIPQPQIGSPRILSPDKPGYARFVHTSQHAHRMSVLAQ